MVLYVYWTYLQLCSGGKFSKDSSLRLSDWECMALQEDQVYAALRCLGIIQTFASVKDVDLFGKTLLDYMPIYLHCSLQYIKSPVPLGHIGDNLYPVVQNLFSEYGPLECDTTKKFLFDHDKWKQARHILKAIRMREELDPPGIPLYFEKGGG